MVPGLRPERMAQLEQFFDAAPFLVLVLEGADHRVRYANPAFLGIVGGREIVGRKVAEAVPELTDQDYLRRLDEVFATGQPFIAKSARTRLERPGGAVEVRWFDCSCQPSRDATGAIDGVIFYGQEVSSHVALEEALAQSEQRLQIAVRAAGIGIWEWRYADNSFVYSPRAREIAGYPAEGPVTYDMVLASTHPEDLPRTSAMAEQARDPLRRGRGVYDYRLVRPDGEIRDVRAYAETVFENRPEGPVAVRYIGTLEDTTDARRTEALLKASESRLQLAMDAGRMAVHDWDWEREDFPLTTAQRELFGLAPDEPSTVGDRRLRYHPDDRERVAATFAAAETSGARYCDFEFRYLRPDARLIWLQVRSEIIRDEVGKPQRLIGVMMDITERKETEERLELLARELDHRANNLLSVIQGAVSLSRGSTVAELREVITGRLASLGRAHRLLSDARWRGAQLRALLAQEVAPFGLDEQVRLDGPDCSLDPQQAQALAMAIHELATNAVKYGALSRRAGRVELTWGIEDGSLRLNWSECGGPAVSPPTHKGLGTTVIQRALGAGLGGSAKLDWREGGVQCRLTLPLNVS